MSDTSVTLKQNQGNQTYNEHVDPQQGFNYAKFKKSRFNNVREKGTLKTFFE